MKVQQESSPEPQVVTRDCSNILCQLHAKNQIPGTSCISPACLQLERELASTLMRIHCFEMSLRDHCFALSFVVSVQARSVCNLKAPIKTLPPTNM